jgi:RNA polymerase sigma factor (TIGR02999 family)
VRLKFGFDVNFDFMSHFNEHIGESTAENPKVASDLLPLVYQELRSLAASRLASEKPGQTFQATALVHEAYLRLVGTDPDVNWNGRGHFFAAAAEAMRRILVENARRKISEKHGGDRHRIPLADAGLAWDMPPDDLLDLNEALTELDQIDPTAASLVRLRYFAGLSVEEAALSLEIAPRSAYRTWAFGRAWLFRRLSG